MIKNGKVINDFTDFSEAYGFIVIGPIKEPMTPLSKLDIYLQSVAMQQIGMTDLSEQTEALYLFNKIFG